MESSILDPFGDYWINGYLRNRFGEKDLAVVSRLEAMSFEDQVHESSRWLRRVPNITYSHICDIHRRLFRTVYPWAGTDRSVNAPEIAIVKAGYNNLFAHPADVRRAAEYALRRASDEAELKAHPGEIFGYLAHSHPFLEGNGRTILTIYTELCRRASFHVAWYQIDKTEFLRTLTDELLNPGTALDKLVLSYVRPGALSLVHQTVQLQLNFYREEVEPVRRPGQA